MINYNNSTQINFPWRHYTFNTMFDNINELVDLSKILLPDPHEISNEPLLFNCKRTSNILADNHHSCEIDVTPEIYQTYEQAKNIIDYFFCDGRVFLEKLGHVSLSNSIFLRVQFVRDLNGYFIKPHTDKSNKLVTLICHLTDTVDGGTQILDKSQKIIYRVGSKKNNGLVFFPNYAPYIKTYHAFVDSKICEFRDTLMVNYYSSPDVKTKYLWKM